MKFKKRTNASLTFFTLFYKNHFSQTILSIFIKIKRKYLCFFDKIESKKATCKKLLIAGI